jgi:hypothetical protein
MSKKGVFEQAKDTFSLSSPNLATCSPTDRSDIDIDGEAEEIETAGP